MRIDLYEDNAGFLHMTNGSKVWVFTEAPGVGCFDRDARAMAEGDDGDWWDAFGGIDAEDRPAPAALIAELEDCALIASWTPESGRVLADGVTTLCVVSDDEVRLVSSEDPDGTHAAVYLARSMTQLEAIATAARALLHRIENITTEDFSLGREQPEREALAAALGFVPSTS